VYTGTALSNLNEVGCSNEFGATLTFHATAGTTYYFQSTDRPRAAPAHAPISEP
jgi:hypothetical protein